jgi:hypothetical protein
MSGMKDAASGMTTAAADTIEKAKDIVTRSTKVYEGASEANTLPKVWITRARSRKKSPNSPSDSRGSRSQGHL